MCLQRLPVRRQSVGRGLQLTPGMASSAVSRLLVLGLIVWCLHPSLNALLFNPSVVIFLCFPAATFLWGRWQDGSQYPYTHSSALGWICWSNSVRPLVFTLRCACLFLATWLISSVVVQSSPQVAGVSRFRFGPSDDLPPTSSSHSDLGQLPSQGRMHYLMSSSLKGLLLNWSFCQILVRLFIMSLFCRFRHVW